MRQALSMLLIRTGVVGVGLKCQKQPCNGLRIRCFAWRSSGPYALPAIGRQGQAALDESPAPCALQCALISKPPSGSGVSVFCGAAARHYDCQRGFGRRSCKTPNATLTHFACSTNSPAALVSSMRRLTTSLADSPCSSTRDRDRASNSASDKDEPATNFMSSSLVAVLTQAEQCRKASEQWLGIGSVPILSDWELWACAKQQIDQHGDLAAEAAAMQADALLEAGDLDGVKAWATIRNRILVLQGRTDNETAH